MKWIMAEKAMAQQSDEIDLIELVVSIWRKKWWVVLFTVIFAMAGVFYALTAKEQWTSKAEVIAPQTIEISDILTQRLAYARITGVKVENLEITLYGNFIKQLRSVNIRTDFFRQSDIYKQLTQDLEGESAKKNILKSLANRQVFIEWPNKKKDIDYPTVSFYAEEPELAQKTLEQFVDFVNQKTIERSEKNFWVAVDNKVAALKFYIKRVEDNLPEERQVRLENLKLALEMAKKANIKEYSLSVGDGALNVSNLKVGQADIQLTDDQLSNNSFLFS